MNDTNSKDDQPVQSLRRSVGRPRTYVIDTSTVDGRLHETLVRHRLIGVLGETLGVKHTGIGKTWLRGNFLHRNAASAVFTRAKVCDALLDVIEHCRDRAWLYGDMASVMRDPTAPNNTLYKDLYEAGQPAFDENLHAIMTSCGDAKLASKLFGYGAHHSLRTALVTNKVLTKEMYYPDSYKIRDICNVAKAIEVCTKLADNWKTAGDEVAALRDEILAMGDKPGCAAL